MKKLIFRVFGIFIVSSFLFSPVLAAPTGQTGAHPIEPEPARHLYAINDKPLYAPGYTVQLEPTKPSLPDDTGYAWWRIVFQSYQHGSIRNYVIKLIGPDSGEIQLTFGTQNDINPSLNVGCTQIAFASDRRGNYDIYSMNIDGSGQKPLTSNKKNDVNPDWSPDGSRILFQSYRDGQSEIYVMNADGSHQTRLTNDPNYDGMPAWSPDGRKIAFISNRSGGYRVYVMNQDGSELVQLSSQADSEHPTWSPDSSKIAYDADGNGDGWQELWYMASDGSNQHKVYQPAIANTDAYVGNWAPDGQYIVYSEVSWVFMNNNWYWQTARLLDFDTELFYSFMISGGAEEWDPYWQTTDGVPPVSSMAALPDESLATFIVSWSGYDTGPSGFRNFDVDVRDGVAGNWTRWQNATTSTSAIYTGKGGHTYYFRSRGRTNAGIAEQWPADYDTYTRVESYPPRSDVLPLPAHLRNGSLISWTGFDIGGSGIKSFDVQTRDSAGGDWVSWLTGTTQTQEIFSGTPGHTYSFRVRGTDLAENVEAWHAGDGDTSTTIFSWAASGIIVDNTDAPVASVDVAISQNSTTHTNSDKEGNYQAYMNETAPGFTMDWQKVGYDDLPETHFPTRLDVSNLVIMPTNDNATRNWGFENGGLGADWGTSGMYLTVITDVVSHSGNYAAALGPIGPELGPVEKIGSEIIGTNPEIKVDLQIKADLLGIVRAIWRSGDGWVDSDCYYSQRDLSGHWLSPINVSKRGTVSTCAFEVDGAGNVYIVWSDSTGIYYLNRKNDNAWTAPYQFANSVFFTYKMQIAVSGSGDLHVIWTGSTGYVSYAERYKNGSWSDQENLFPCTSYFATMVFDKKNVLHLVWSHSNESLYYAQKRLNQPWYEMQDIANMRTASPKMIMDDQGQLHVVYFNPGDLSIYYLFRNIDGIWSPPEKLSGDTGGWYFDAHDLAVDANGNIYVIWRTSSQVEVRKRSFNGSWNDPLVLDTSLEDPGIVADDQGRVYAFWVKETIGHSTPDDIYYAWTDKNGDWSDPHDISNSPSDSYQPTFLLDQRGQPHVAWLDNYIGEPGVFYRGPSLVPQDGEANLSQRLTIPVTMTAPTLSFLYQIKGASIGAGLGIHISDSLTDTQVMSIDTDHETWSHAWADLSRWSGQTITLTLSLKEVAGLPFARTLLDEVTIGSAHPDVWVSAQGAPYAPPGHQIVYQLTYGNRGGLAAPGTVTTATLPAELEFTSASLNPTITGNTLTWSVGDLAAKSGPYSILITATVAVSDTILHHITLPATIRTTGQELEIEDNHDQVNTSISWPVFLPLTRRE